MDLEPLPKVTFLPAPLTELVIKGWTGDTIDYMKNGQICKVYDGQGTCSFRDGHEYKGELKHGLLHGRGRFEWTDKTRYTGTFHENEITGTGRYDWPDGSTYNGKVLNGLRHGKGTYVNAKEGVEYEGEWQHGLRHGYGELKYRNGSIYQGQWERGMKWGQGKMTYASGNYYEGSWRDNKRNGQGVMNWLNTNEKYTGNWEDNFQSGFGTHIWLEANGDNKLLRNRYVGFWKEGLRHGKGTFYYSNGSKYEGDWFENYKHGHGLFTFEDGTEYDGPFEKDRMIERKITDSYSPDGSKARREVEQNPFKKLIDISDLIVFEQNAAEVQKECQNILLRHNSELKQWYKIYARKVETTKSEESFSMTLRQVWRFLRDCQIVNGQSSLAQFDRIYHRGKKNHFSLLGAEEINKFNQIYNQKAQNPKDIKDDSDFSEEEEESTEQMQERLGIEPDDIHSATKVVLQRQFFEAIVRAASARFANDNTLPSLSDQLDYLFKTKLMPLAGKNKAKTPEEEKNFKIAETVFDVYDAQLKQVFKYFSSKASKSSTLGQLDITLTVADLMNMLIKCKLLSQDDDVDVSGCVRPTEVIEIIERYYASEDKLETRLTPEIFHEYIKQNPMLLLSNQKAAAKKEREAARLKRQQEQANENKQDEDGNAEQRDESEEQEEQSEHEDEEVKRAREEQEMQDLEFKWKKRVISEYMLNLKGAEIVFFEFKEILLELTIRLRDAVDPKTGKIRIVLTKFFDDWLLKRLQPYIKFSIPTTKAVNSNKRQWPESEKDVQIKVKMLEKQRREEEEHKLQQEKARQQAELARMAEEDTPALDLKEVEERRRKLIEEEEQARRLREAEEEEEEEDDDPEDDDMQDHDDDSDY